MTKAYDKKVDQGFNSESGFTLIEIIMVIVIIGIIGLTVGMLMYQGTSTVRTMSARAVLRAEGVLATERLSREFRRIRCTIAGASCAPAATLNDINTWTADELRFITSEYEGRGVRLAGTELMLRRGAAGTDPEDKLASYVTGFTLTYFQRDGTAASTVNSIWTVVADLTFSKDGETLNYRVAVHPRSFN